MANRSSGDGDDDMETSERVRRLQDRMNAPIEGRMLMVEQDLERLTELVKTTHGYAKAIYDKEERDFRSAETWRKREFDAREAQRLRLYNCLKGLIETRMFWLVAIMFASGWILMALALRSEVPHVRIGWDGFEIGAPAPLKTENVTKDTEQPDADVAATGSSTSEPSDQP